MGPYPDPSTTSILSISSQLRSLVMRCRVPCSECEDCIQQSWLALVTAHPDWVIDDPRTLAWLIAVTRRKALDFHRDQKRHGAHHLDDMPPISVFDPAQAPPGPDQNGGDQEVISTLLDRVDRLSEVNREILISRILLGLTFREIGSAMNLGSEQVKKRYYRNLHRLQKELRPRMRGSNDGGGGGKWSFLLRILHSSGSSVTQALQPEGSGPAGKSDHRDSPTFNRAKLCTNLLPLFSQ